MLRIALLSLIVGFALVPAASAQDAAAVERVRQLYQNLEYEEAEREARRAIENADVYDVDQLAALHSLMALIHYIEQREDEARAEFLTALSLDPELDLDPVLVPPRALTFFEELRNEARAGFARDEGRSARYIVMVDPRPAAALRSAVLPGWGQIHKGQTTKGWLMGAAFAGSTLGAAVLHLRNEAEDDPLTGPSDGSGAGTAGNVLLAASAGIWLYSYLDALLYDNGRRPRADRFQLHAMPAAGGFRVAGRVTF